MIEMLFLKWGADFLVNDEFNRAISLLAEPGLSDQHLSLLDRLPYAKDSKACERWEGQFPFITPEDSNLLRMGCLRFDLNDIVSFPFPLNVGEGQCYFATV